MERPEDVVGPKSGLWDPAGPKPIPSKAFTFVVCLWVFLSLGAMAFLCAQHRVSDLERRLEAPTVIP